MNHLLKSYWSIVNYNLLQDIVGILVVVGIVGFSLIFSSTM